MEKEKIKKILSKALQVVRPSKKELQEIEKQTKKIVKKLNDIIEKEKISAKVFVGGSVAKGTLVRREIYDIDIFIRFSKKYNDISDLLEKLLKNIGFRTKRIHGSRDYFILRKGKLLFEFIPVLKIRKPEEAENITDLSWFHVAYVKKQLKKNPVLADEILLTKAFCYAQNCYGAESHIRGFSGYAIELLVLYYKGFINLLRAISKIRKKTFIDPARHYKNKHEIMISMNESKLLSPLVFVDPTYKERNVLAALSDETFERFRQACKRFLARPSIDFFYKKEISEQKLEQIAKSKNAELLWIDIKTDKQEGSIAGSKLKKFYEFLLYEVGKHYNIIEAYFEYDGKKNASCFFIAKRKKEIVMEGPPINQKEHVKRFRAKHKKTFVKGKRIYAREETKAIKEIIRDIKKRNIPEEMSITNIKVYKQG